MSEISGIETKLLIAIVGPTLAFFLWFGKRLYDERKNKRQAEKDKQNLIRALYAEIDFNTRDMEIFLEKSIPQEDLRKILQDKPALIPHITDARHTQIYQARITEVHNIADGALHSLVEFYALLEKIRVQVDGVNLPSYKTLTTDGRVNAVEVIRRTAEKSRARGVELLGIFERDYEELGLARRHRN
ncbi:hypothetical protein AB838_09270 [Rhodobacteraceae bacterium (ex Bugula neritina AB1)]|nr:hypothetical protein AB838_09270 [Rhodobacteraceae bacterium (ex Bugula neritina AB1)]